MDTGSCDLWVPAQGCKTLACKVHNTFGSNDSSTLRESEKPWQIQYGTGLASGIMIADSVSIANLTIKYMPFGIATNVSDNFAQLVIFLHLIC